MLPTHNPARPNPITAFLLAMVFMLEETWFLACKALRIAPCILLLYCPVPRMGAGALSEDVGGDGFSGLRIARFWRGIGGREEIYGEVLVNSIACI